MRIKVDGTWHDGEQVPIMVELTLKDKFNISNMPAEAKRYCVYPDTMTTKEIKRWIADA